MGAIAAAYLAGAGVGYIRLIDGDAPSISNLHRQVFFTGTEEEPKSVALQKRLAALNPTITLLAETAFLNRRNAADLLGGEVDLVLECTDQAYIKHLVSDFCAINEIPLLYGAVHRTQGYVALFANQLATDAHLRDLFPEPDDRLPTCAEVGVLNTAAGIIGLIQANEALKWILSLGEPLRNRLLTFDALTYRQQIIKLQASFEGDLERIWETANYGYQEQEAPEVQFSELAEWPAGSYQLFSLLPTAQEPMLLPGATRYTKKQMTLPGKKVFYCQYGRQSLAVAKQLRAQGIEAYSVQGGRDNATNKT